MPTALLAPNSRETADGPNWFIRSTTMLADLEIKNMKKQHYEAILEESKVPIFIDPSLAPPPGRQSISWRFMITQNHLRNREMKHVIALNNQMIWPPCEMNKVGKLLLVIREISSVISHHQLKSGTLCCRLYLKQQDHG